jgi:hypothetical protein
MSRQDFRHVPARLAAVCAAFALAACSGGETADANGASVAGRADPPGAALPLSIGDPGENASEDALTAAINCAAALELTSERLAQMASGGASQEIALITRAGDYFTAEAAREGQNRVSSAEAMIGRRKQEKASETTGQAQLAIACLRRYGEAIG